MSPVGLVERIEALVSRCLAPNLLSWIEGIPQILETITLQAELQAVHRRVQFDLGAQWSQRSKQRLITFALG